MYTEYLQSHTDIIKFKEMNKYNTTITERYWFLQLEYWGQ